MTPKQFRERALKTNSKAITLNMMPSDFDALTRHAEKRGCSRSQLLRDALRAYLGIDPKVEQSKKGN